MFSAYDDLSIVSNDLTRAKGFTLVAIMRNEMYGVEAFLRHYRNLGVERFIMLDDRSDDGTREYLCEQADVMVLESSANFVDMYNPNGHTPLPDMRALIVWRNVLMWKYVFDEWALMVDGDEYVILPDGMSLFDVASLADKEGCRSVQGIMLDCYPQNITDLEVDVAFDADGDWFFDGLQHLHLTPGGDVSLRYSGARARLISTYGIRPYPLRNRLRNKFKSPWFPPFVLNQKEILHRWGETSLFTSSHVTTNKASGRILIPMKHFKINRDVFKKIEITMSKRQFRTTQHLEDKFSELMMEMRQKKGSFLFSYSRRATGYDVFANTGNALMG